MKKILLTLCAALAALSLVAAEYTDSNGYTWRYRIVGNGAEIYNIYEYEHGSFSSDNTAVSPLPVGVVTIPSTLGGKPVTIIGSSALSECSSMTGVIIPNSVTNIERSAFSGCSTLATIVIPDKVVAIGEYAFYNCSVLASVTLPSGLKLLGNSCFSGCSVLPSISIPNGVERIPGSCFYDCSSLRSVSLPDSIVAIGDLAFYRCSSLKSLTIPNGVASIGSGAFEQSGVKSIWLPDSMLSIGAYAFSSCSDLRDVRLSNGLTSIGGGVFYEAGLESAVIPASVVSLGTDSFNCYWRDSDRNYHYLTNVVFRGALPAGVVASKILQNATSVYYPRAYEEDFADYVDDAIFAGYTDSLQFDDNPPSAAKYTVVFNANGGTGTMAAQSFAIGVSQELRANAFSRSGFYFVGWATSANGGAVYSDGHSVKDLTLQDGDTVTLYAVWGRSGGGGGGDPSPDAVANDDFSNAIQIYNRIGRTTGSNDGATIELGESAFYDSKTTVWYVWKAPSSGPETFDTFGSGFDTVIVVYAHSEKGLELLAFNDDSDESSACESKVTFEATRNAYYRIAVGGASRDTGDIALNWYIGDPAEIADPANPGATTVVITNFVDFVTVETNHVEVVATNFVDVAVFVTNVVTDHVCVTNIVRAYETVTNFVTQTVVDAVTSYLTITNIVEETNLVSVAATNIVTDFVSITNVVRQTVVLTNIVTIAEDAAAVPDEVRDFEPVEDFAGEDKRKTNGIVFDADGVMRGIVQLETAKATTNGAKVKGFVMLEDGKKVSMKSVTAPISEGRLVVRTGVGKLGEISLVVGDDGFVGEFAGMRVVSADLGDESGVLSGSLTVKYIDSSGKVKNRKVAIGGVVTGGTASGTATAKGAAPKAFAAEFE